MCMNPTPQNPKNEKVTVLGLGGSEGRIVHYIAEQCNDYNLLYMDHDEKNFCDEIFV